MGGATVMCLQCWKRTALFDNINYEKKLLHIKLVECSPYNVAFYGIIRITFVASAAEQGLQ